MYPNNYVLINNFVGYRLVLKTLQKIINNDLFVIWSISNTFVWYE